MTVLQPEESKRAIVEMLRTGEALTPGVYKVREHTLRQALDESAASEPARVVAPRNI